jgi:peroxiredoxin
MSYSTPIIPSDLLHKISTIELPSVETISRMITIIVFSLPGALPPTTPETCVSGVVGGTG